MLLETRNLGKIYYFGLFVKTRTYALSEVDIHIDSGETVGIFGKSGSGKTTLSNLIAGVLPATSGQIFWKGEPVSCPYRGGLRRSVQMVYQHPEEVFDPSWDLMRSLLEPCRIHRLPCTGETLRELMDQVGLYEEHLGRSLGELSGGELQRAALIRIMLMQPELILLDEPTSMLDAISQAQILQILREYQERCGCAYLLISHDMAVIRHMCGRCYFLENGKVARQEVYGHE